MEDDLNFFANGRRPQFFNMGKTTSSFEKLKKISFFLTMEDHLILFVIRRRSQFWGKWKTTSTFEKGKLTNFFQEMEETLNQLKTEDISNL